MSGLLLALSFPRFGHPSVAWIALAPLLLTLVSGSLTRAFLLGLTTGAVYFAGTLYWLTHVMTLYGDLQRWVGILINAALVAYLALFPAIFAVVVRRIVAQFGVLALMTAPLVWVATELGRTYLFTGFPWVLLGYSQTSVLSIAQVASVFGVYGVSALVASVGAGVAVLGLRLAGGSGGKRADTGSPVGAENPAKAGSHERWVAQDGTPSVGSGFSPPAVGSGFSRVWPVFGRMAPLVAPLAVVALVAAWGSARIAASALIRQGEAIRVGLVQGNVDQAEKWDRARADGIFADYLRKTEDAIAKGAEVVIWPEASIPFLFDEDRVAADRVRAIAQRSGVPILVGSDQVERGAPLRLFNAALLVGPDGRTQGVYRKMHLVPFGEYVPLQKLFFFAAPLVEAVGGFSPGEEAVLLPVKGHAVSTAICYEVVYPNLVRRFVAGGSELLTTITNDAWFGRTSAPYQHFAQASMRAIENGRYLVRAANTGISGVVDPYGRVVAASPIFEPAVIVREVRFLESLTLYTRIGDVFAYASVIVTLAMLVVARRRVQWKN